MGGTGFDFLDLGSAGEWLAWADYHMLSNANWGVYDKAGEKNALSEAGASGSGGWPLSQVTESGKWVRNYFYNGMGGGGGSPGGGCCKFGADCGDCGDDGTGWCHLSASNCATCTGTYNAGASRPSCPPTPLPEPVPGWCCWTGCTSCQPDPNNYCSNQANCEGSCGGGWCPK